MTTPQTIYRLALPADLETCAGVLYEADDALSASRGLPVSPRNREALWKSVNADDRGGPRKFRASRGAKADRALRKHRYRIADLDIAALSAAETRGHNIRAH